jgi:hypothetical protein
VCVAAYLRDSWSWLDLATVGVSFTVFMPKASTNVSGLRALRALRPLRTIKGMPGMRVLVATLIESIPLMLDVLFLMGFVFIIFGIIGQEVRSLSPCIFRWKRKCSWSLYQKRPLCLALIC